MTDINAGLAIVAGLVSFFTVLFTAVSILFIVYDRDVCA